MFKYGLVNYIFGSPGAGKTCVLAMLNRYFLKKGYNTFSNFPLLGSTQINDEDLGYYSFSHGVILLDEAGIIFNNRDACNKRGLMQDKNRLSYWRLIRHDHVHAVFIVSQTWDDVDKKLRDICNNYFLIKKYAIFTLIRPIYKKVDIDAISHQPTDFFVFDIFWSWRLCLRRKYFKDFNSYSMKDLPPYPAQPITSDC